MSIFKYTAAELFTWLTNEKDMVVLDVRNKVDFARFKVESPYPFVMQNISYFDFMEIEDECVAKVIKDKPVRIVCAKEGSAKFVAEILDKHGLKDVGYLEGGIKSWEIPCAGAYQSRGSIPTVPVHQTRQGIGPLWPAKW